MEVNELPPKSLPHGWMSEGSFGPGGWIYYDQALRLRVIQTLSDKNDFGDGRVWLHVSVAHPRRIPTYDELTEVKRLFVGEERKAFMIFPPVDEHVNIHEFCLHLYSCMDSDVLPDFTMGSGMI